MVHGGPIRSRGCGGAPKLAGQRLDQTTSVSVLGTYRTRSQPPREGTDHYRRKEKYL
jgi:hypothetical protein